MGFESASNEIKEKKELKRKMTIAYERFRYVRPEKFEAFNTKLREKTQKEDKYAYTYDSLKFTEVKDYSQVPPTEVLDKIAEAKEVGCFDTFEIATIESVREVKAPIVFGVICGCPDKFFVAQWMDDVSIEDILAEDEG